MQQVKAGSAQRTADGVDDHVDGGEVGVCLHQVVGHHDLVEAAAESRGVALLATTNGSDDLAGAEVTTDPGDNGAKRASGSVHQPPFVVPQLGDGRQLENRGGRVGYCCASRP